jgi:hypothetical protein
MIKHCIASAVVALGLMTASASAGPMPGPGSGPEAGGLVEKTQGYRYRRDCVWVNGGWHYGKPGAYLVCRPYRPSGRGWTWYSEGGRHGWYQPQRKSWHYNKW